MNNYNNYRFIYPPRPKNAIPPEDLSSWDNDTLLAQPKFDGSNCVIFMNGKDVMIMNRHNQVLSNVVLRDEIKSLFKGEEGKWTVLNGEYLNKSKSDKFGNFNHKLIIFDILVHESNYLIGSTFLERIELLKKIYGEENSNRDYLYKVSDNVYLTKTYTHGFYDLFNEFNDINVVEGLVLKRSNAKLEIGISESNNVKSQIKCRKRTKNYKF